MPIYEYECKACSHRFEAIQKFSDSPLLECPTCAAAELRKLVSAPAFRLKGAGWYETDFKSGGKRNLAGDAGDSAGSSGGGTATGTSDGASSGGKETSGGAGSDSTAKPAAASAGSTSNGTPAGAA